MARGERLGRQDGARVPRPAWDSAAGTHTALQLRARRAVPFVGLALSTIGSAWCGLPFPNEAALRGRWVWASGLQGFALRCRCLALKP